MGIRVPNPSAHFYSCWQTVAVEIRGARRDRDKPGGGVQPGPTIDFARAAPLDRFQALLARAEVRGYKLKSVHAQGG